MDPGIAPTGRYSHTDPRTLPRSRSARGPAEESPAALIFRLSLGHGDAARVQCEFRKARRGPGHRGRSPSRIPQGVAPTTNFHPPGGRHDRLESRREARASPEVSRGEPPAVRREVQGAAAGSLQGRRGEGDRGGEDAGGVAPGDHGPGDPRSAVTEAGGGRGGLHARLRRACAGAPRGGSARWPADRAGRRPDRGAEGRGAAAFFGGSGGLAGRAPEELRGALRAARGRGAGGSGRDPRRPRPLVDADRRPGAGLHVQGRRPPGYADGPRARTPGVGAPRGSRRGRAGATPRRERRRAPRRRGRRLDRPGADCGRR